MNFHAFTTGNIAGSGRQPRVSKKLKARDFRLCTLEPVETKAPLPIPDVPEHFNYGIFYDDNYDYMQHIKSRDECGTGKCYRIITPEGKPSSSNVPQTDVVILEPVDYSNSTDTSSDDDGELEENFVELAGGPKLREGSDEPDAQYDKFQGRPELLSMQKVLMMEKFLFGTNQQSSDLSEECAQEPSLPTLSRSGKPMTDEELYLQQEFSQLLVKCKQHFDISDVNSCASNASVYSENLHHALEADFLATEDRKMRRELDSILEEDKNIILSQEARLMETDDKDDSLEEWLGEPKTFAADVMSLASSNKGNLTRLPKKLLVPPPYKTRKGSTTGEDTLSVAKQGKPVPTPRESASADCRSREESSEEKKARKKLVRLDKFDRRQIRKINKENFKCEIVSLRPAYGAKFRHIE
ncbi:unnamed protein product [Protopolystoma xenopodis]|uniref:Protein LTV1 homolog n=1 Tax=Protopolystoma xenopodis TaxID=117903 RepID=A0A3S5AZN9_9PLAT|nr:unnamed protein product [Protopolystoma xenopodis]